MTACKKESMYIVIDYQVVSGPEEPVTKLIQVNNCGAWKVWRRAKKEIDRPEPPKVIN